MSISILLHSWTVFLSTKCIDNLPFIRKLYGFLPYNIIMWMSLLWLVSVCLLKANSFNHSNVHLLFIYFLRFVLFVVCFAQSIRRWYVSIFFIEYSFSRTLFQSAIYIKIDFCFSFSVFFYILRMLYYLWWTINTVYT